MNFDHAESAVLATVHVAMPQGFALPALNHKGLPEFEVTPAEAREACNHLRLRGFVAKVGPYEAACGIDFVTRWLAASSGRLLIDIPTGRGVTAEDILSLHSVMNAAATQILDFYEKTPRPAVADVMSAIQEAMQTLAWHRGNVEKRDQPELDFQEV